MSGGVLRPKDCSMPDERLLANISMSGEEVVHSLAQAAEWIASADALLIGSGAGMGVDAGLGTFRGGKKGLALKEDLGASRCVGWLGGCELGLRRDLRAQVVR